jgi:uncharacterized membrane protein YbhN (UPF0104 family)
MKKRQVAFLIAKIVFAAAVLVWLFQKVDVHRVWAAMRDAHRTPIFVGLGLCWSTIALAAWRWHRLLRVFDIGIRFKSLICIVQIGQLFAMFLPGPTGDDLTRMLYISRLAPGRVAESCSTVLLDRCIGLTGLFLLAGVCIPWQWPLLTASNQTYWLAMTILGGATFVAVGGAVFFLAGHPTHRWFARKLRSRPAHSLRDEAARIWGLFCDNKIVIAQVIAVAVATQLVNCVLFHLAGAAVGIDLPLQTWLTFVPIVLAASALPISIAGLGVREYLLVLFLRNIADVDTAQTLAASLVVFAMILTISLLGGLLYVFYRPKGAPPTADEVAAA